MKGISINRVYSILLKTYGKQGWWPGRSKVEVCIGAILTQNVAWKNVEKAIKNLRNQALLSPEKLAAIPEKQLAPLIRSSGYFNQKALKIKYFLKWFEKYNYSFNELKKIEKSNLRKELLSVKGIGPETADSILLYALSRKIFVVDAYTKRIFTRLGFLSGNEKYDEIQMLFHRNFKGSTQDYNEYHALIVNQGKDICKGKALCGLCCLEKYCLKVN